MREKGYLNVFTPFCEAIFHPPDAGESEEAVEDIAHAFKTNAFKDCHKYVRDAAEILEEML